MAYDYDEQLIEAMGARRQRLAQALMYGPDRLLRRWTNRLSTHLVSAFVAVLICTVCVAVSFVTNLLAKDPSLQRNRPTAPVTRSAPATPATPPAKTTPARTPAPKPTKVAPSKPPATKAPATKVPSKSSTPSPTTPARKAP